MIDMSDVYLFVLNAIVAIGLFGIAVILLALITMIVYTVVQYIRRGHE